MSEPSALRMSRLPRFRALPPGFRDPVADDNRDDGNRQRRQRGNRERDVTDKHPIDDPRHKPTQHAPHVGQCMSGGSRFAVRGFAVRVPARQGSSSQHRGNGRRGSLFLIWNPYIVVNRPKTGAPSRTRTDTVRILSPYQATAVCPRVYIVAPGQVSGFAADLPTRPPIPAPFRQVFAGVGKGD